MNFNKKKYKQKNLNSLYSKNKKIKKIKKIYNF